jgi:hypothetical protein
MSTNGGTPAQKYFPQIDKNVQAEVTVHLQRLYTAINDHDQAIVTLNNKVTGGASSTAGSTTNITSTTTEFVTTGGVTSFNALTGAIVYFPFLGTVNNQSGVVSYTTQTGDNGALVVLDDASAIAVTLNFAVMTPWFTTISNQGSGTATITPSQGLINGGASISIAGGLYVTIFFDGANWWADSETGGGGGGTITAVVAGTGLNGGGSSGSVTLNLDVPVAVADGGTGTTTPSLVAGTNVTITGTWPDQTINASGASGLPVNDPTFTGTMTGPHYASNGSAPTVTVGPAAGTGATATVAGTDTAGVISLVTGAGPSTGLLLTVAYTSSYPTGSVVIVNAANPAALCFAAGTATSFGVSAGGVATGSYEIAYIVSGM